MRVQTGTAKGRKLKIPKNGSIRPTTSRVKKSIFDRLGNLEGLSVLDLFSGSGSLGIEALSRNASEATFVEKQKTTAKTLRENIKSCGFEKLSETVVDDFNKAVKKLIRENRKFDLIFIDPPYNLYSNLNVPDLVSNVDRLLKEHGTVVVEHDQSFEYSDPKFILDTKNYGGTNISFFWSVN